MKKVGFVVILFVVSFLSTIVGANYLYGGAKVSNPIIVPKDNNSGSSLNKPSLPDLGDKTENDVKEANKELEIIDDNAEQPIVVPGNNNGNKQTPNPQPEKQPLTTFLVVNYEDDDLVINTTDGYKYTITGQVASKKENGKFFVSLQLLAPVSFTDSVLSNRSLKIQNTEFKGNNLTLGEGTINGKKYVSVDLLITPGNGLVESIFRFTMDWGNGIVENYTVAINVTQAK